MDTESLPSSSIPALGSSTHCRGSAMRTSGSSELLGLGVLACCWCPPCSPGLGGTHVCVAVVCATDLQSPPKILGLFSLRFVPCALT